MNRKIKESEMKYSYVGTVGEIDVNEYLEKLVDLHLKLVEAFKDVDPSSMYGV